jgi:hypothetical protein
MCVAALEAPITKRRSSAISTPSFAKSDLQARLLASPDQWRSSLAG